MGVVVAVVCTEQRDGPDGDDTADSAVAVGEAAIGLAGLWLGKQQTADGHARLIAVLKRALAGLDPDSPLGLRLRLRMTAELEYGSGRFEETLSLAEQIRRGADVTARAEAAHVTLNCVVGPDHTALRHSFAEQLLADGMWYGRSDDLLTGLVWRTVNLLLDGDPHADRSLRELRAIPAEQHHVGIGAVVDAIDVMRQIRAGQLDAAMERIAAHARAGRPVDDPDTTIGACCMWRTSAGTRGGSANSRQPWPP